MKISRKAVVSAAMLGAALTLATASFVHMAAAQPLTIQGEERAHPTMARAIQALNASIRDLEATPESYGGNKDQALHDIRIARHSLLKALYFRLHMDDAALDRLP